jgi:hypothetical protein
MAWKGGRVLAEMTRVMKNVGCDADCGEDAGVERRMSFCVPFYFIARVH